MTDKTLLEKLSNLESKIDKLFSLFQAGSSASQIESKYTFYSWLEEWCKLYKAPKLKPYSLRCIKTGIKLHIKPYIQDKPLNEVTGLEIQKAINEIPTSRIRKSTYDIYSGSFRQALRNKLIAENPMLMVDSVKHKRKQGRALTVEEQRQFIECLKDNKLKPLYVFYLLSGCRKSEALAIKWADVDYKEARIHIRGTKTATADRAIPLFPEIDRLLKKLPKQSEYIFPYTDNSLKCNFKRLRDKYEFTFSIHSLRHTFATRCLEAKISSNTVQKWMGHAKASTTVDIYSHVQTALELQEIVKFNPKFD